MTKKTPKRRNAPSGKARIRGGGSDRAHAETTAIQVPPGDIALVLGKNADGVHILRRRSEEAPIEAGLLRPVREGKPIVGEVVSLSPRPDLPMVFDVKSEFSSDAPQGDDPAAGRPERPPLDGPAQVASDAYRRGWDAVWGSRRRDRSVN